MPFNLINETLQLRMNQNEEMENFIECIYPVLWIERREIVS